MTSPSSQMVALVVVLLPIGASTCRLHDPFPAYGFGLAGEAYFAAVINSRRWGTLWPAYRVAWEAPPTLREQYTHWPLGLHVHDRVAARLFGLHERSLRLVQVAVGLVVQVQMVGQSADEERLRAAELLPTVAARLLPPMQSSVSGETSAGPAR